MVLVSSIFIASLIQALAFFIFPLLNIVIYDNLIITLDKQLLVKIILLILLLILFIIAFSLLLDITAAQLRTKLSFLLRLDLIEPMLNYDYKFYINHETGQLIQNTIPDIDVVSGSIVKFFQSLAMALQLVIFFSIVYFIDKDVFFTYLGILLLYWFWLLFWKPFVKSTSLKIGEEYRKLYTYLYEVFPGIKEIKYLCLNNYIIDRLYVNLSDLNSQLIKNSIYNSFLYMSSSVIPLLGFGAILTQGIYKLESGKFTIGFLVAVLGFMWRFFSPIDKITEGFSAIQEASNALKRIKNIQGDFLEPNGIYKFSGLKESIKYSNVSFKYEDRPILRDINLEIKKGQNIAIVGQSGSGKTTIVHLLIKLFSGYKGGITIDGLELSKHENLSLRKNISIVSQDIYLFNDTIRRNIDFAGILTDGEILKCCEYSHLKLLVDKLPSGLDTIIGERGVKLSGGEKQRLALARTFAKNSDIIIFDEATSALDPNLEKNIKESLISLQRGKTTITITHRPNTIVDLDWIYVIKNGEIAEQGKHPQLLSKKEHYYELFYEK